MPKKREIPPREDLENLYVTQRLSMPALGAHYQGSTYLAKTWLRHYGIPSHPTGTNLTLKEGNRVEIGDTLHDVLVGELLGDGCITWGDHTVKEKSYSGVFAYCTSKKGYLEWLFQLLGDLGLKQGGNTLTKITQPSVRDSGFYTLKESTSYRAKTLTYRELRAYREKWYLNETKRPPADIVITPTVLRHWFIGDGTLAKITSNRTRGNGEFQYSQVVLCTNGFTWEDCEVLALKLQALGLPFEVKGHHQNWKGVKTINPQLRLPKPATNTPLFFDFIGPCPEGIEEDYGYKWDWVTKKVPKKVPKPKTEWHTTSTSSPWGNWQANPLSSPSNNPPGIS